MFSSFQGLPTHCLTAAQEVLPVLKWLWKTCCQLKHKIFFWLLIYNCLNARALLQHKSIFIPDYSCVIYGRQALETRDHLFLTCPFAQLCWSYLSPTWSPTVGGIQAQVHNLKHLLNVPFALEIIILAAWAIWNTRNDFIFKGIPPNLYSCRNFLKEELKWIIYRAKRQDYASFGD